ncbi:ABC transporter substrate-binding protein [Patescibacteria group bacterium]
MKYFKILQSKILWLELRFRYAINTLTPALKKILLMLVFLFLISGVILIYKIDQKISIEVPTSAGTLREGIIGTPRFVNPILTISDADRDLTMLVYSGLMRSQEDRLVFDLAESYEVSEDGSCYTFTLKPKLSWSDGKPLTSDDILFTIEQIKHPETKSPKRATWEGVDVVKIDDQKIKFCLEKPYAPFLENTTIGILPFHIWKNVLPEQMPLSNFNIDPIGSGPFKIDQIDRNSSGIIKSYTLIPNKNFSLKKPYLKKIILKFYPSEKDLISAYKQKEIGSLSAISPKDILDIKRSSSYLKNYSLSRIFAVFFNQDKASIFTNQEIRKALNFSVDKDKIVNEVLQNFGTKIDNPIPPGSIGYIETVKEEIEATYEDQLKKAKDILENNGWKLVTTKINEGEENETEETVYTKKTKSETKRLEFSISTSNVPDLVNTAQILKETWENLGAKVNVRIYEIGDLEQNVIRPREYDILLFGEIMSKDPDAFAFWHSSQRNDPGLNIALYANITVDKLLEDARSTIDANEREKKYREFQEELRKDVPAIFLYSPHFIHLLPSSIQGVDEESITMSSERFSQIYDWYTKTKKIWKIFIKE